MRFRLQSALALLDAGLSIYRRHFGVFVLITAAWIVPVAIAGGLTVAGASWLSSSAELWILVGGALLMLPLTAYLVAGLARAADDALAGRPVLIGAALALHPLRAASMSFFVLVYALLMQTVATLVAIFCLCPIWAAGIAFTALMAGVASSDTYSMAIGLIALTLFMGGGYLLGLVTVGAGGVSMVYALQPWSVSGLKFGEAIQQSLELIAYRFIGNAVVWFLAAMLVSAGGLSVAIVIGVLAPLPAFWLLGESNEIAQAIAVAAWVAGLIVVIPPISIWMALLYRRNLAAREGADLQERVTAWLGEGETKDEGSEMSNQRTQNTAVNDEG